MEYVCRWVFKFGQLSSKAFLVIPNGSIVKNALCFEFPNMNNKAEYEVLTTKFKIAKELGIWSLKVCSDS